MTAERCGISFWGDDNVLERRSSEACTNLLYTKGFYNFKRLNDIWNGYSIISISHSHIIGTLRLFLFFHDRQCCNCYFESFAKQIN